MAVGIFRSQRHVVQIKKKLEALSLPYFMQVTEKKGTGFALRTTKTTNATLEAAKAALAKNHYDYKTSGSGLTAYFHYDYEAAKALALVKAAGATATVSPTKGELPVAIIYFLALIRASPARKVLLSMNTPVSRITVTPNFSKRSWESWGSMVAITP